MALYIAQYGLTMKRVLPSLFMLWMAIVFVMIIIRQFKKIKLVRPAAFCGAAIYMLICALPLQQLINSYNVAFGY